MSEEEKYYSEVFVRYYPELLRFGKCLVANEYLVEETIQELFLYFFEKQTDLRVVDITNGGLKNNQPYLT